MSQYPLESLLRPPVEYVVTAATLSAGMLVLAARNELMLVQEVAWGAAGVLFLMSAWWARRGARIMRYRRGLRRLPLYRLRPRAVPQPPGGLFLGRGFRWQRCHAQRLADLRTDQGARYLRPGMGYRGARFVERRLPFAASLAARLSPPLPELGGLPALHGLGLLEGVQDVVLPMTERAGHMLVFGTTGVGKSRLLELIALQDIRRCEGPVFVFDPKGDVGLLRRLYSEAVRANREFIFFHLGHPEHSARYNPIGRFTRVTEVSTRVAAQLPTQGDSAAFRNFAWLFSHVIARTLLSLGQKPTYTLIERYLSTTGFEELLTRYLESRFASQGPPDWAAAVEAIKDPVPHTLRDRNLRAVRLAQYAQSLSLFDTDPLALGLRNAWSYPRDYLAKLAASVLPLLAKLLSGRLAPILNPDYGDTDDPRPILDLVAAIRKDAVVYIGLDAMTDAEVSSVVAQAMLGDLASVAGLGYNYGYDQGLPERQREPVISLLLDEVNELVRGGDTLVQILNKGRGAGLRATLFTQTYADLVVGLGGDAQAEQVIGNSTSTLVMQRVTDLRTAQILTQRLPEVEIHKSMLVSGASDVADPDAPGTFSSSSQLRISTEKVALVDPAMVMALSKGQAFVFMTGALWQVRQPLILEDADDLPQDLVEVAEQMQRRY